MLLNKKTPERGSESPEKPCYIVASFLVAIIA